MPKIEIYSSNHCPYCVRAKNMMEQKGVVYETIDISHDETQRDVMVHRSQGRRTVPQIFINDAHIGGYDDLCVLDQKGELDRLIRDEGSHDKDPKESL